MGFVFIGNRIFVNFINTKVKTAKGEKDLLRTVSDWISWSRNAQLITSSQASSIRKRLKAKKERMETFNQVKAFREQLRVMVNQLIEGVPPKEGFLKEINKHLSYPVGRQRVVRRGSKFIQDNESEFLEPIHLIKPIAEDVAHFLCNDNFSLLKKCEDNDCILYFYDNSKNHRRRWCSMMSCGNRAKVAAHYRRNR